MVFLSSNTSLYFLCPPPRGLFLVKSSPAGELSYYTKRANNPQHKANGLSALRLCVWLCDNCGIELFYADYYFLFALRTV